MLKLLSAERVLLLKNISTTNLPDGWEGYTPSVTIYEPDEVQISQVLGPDGKPFAIRRKKYTIGFVLKRTTT